jgi:hypothetical protein
MIGDAVVGALVIVVRRNPVCGLLDWSAGNIRVPWSPQNRLDQESGWKLDLLDGGDVEHAHMCIPSRSQMELVFAF